MLDIQEQYQLSYSCFEPTDDGNFLEFSRRISLDSYNNGEHVEFDFNTLLFNLVIAIEYDKDMFAVEVYGLEELDKRIEFFVSDPDLKAVLKNLTSNVFNRDTSITELNQQRTYFLQAVQNLDQVIEFEEDMNFLVATVPFNVQILCSNGTYRGDEVYVLQISLTSSSIEDQRLADALVQSMLSLYLLEDDGLLSMGNVVVKIRNNLYIDKDNYRVLARDFYSVTDMELVVVPLAFDLNVETELTEYTVPFVPDPEHEDALFLQFNKEILSY